MQGHIRKRNYTTKSGKQTVNWYVVVDLGRSLEGKRKQKWHGGFKTRKQAEVARAKIVGDLHGGSYSEPTRTTFQDWIIEQWLPNVATQVKPSTFDSYQRNLRLHVIPALGPRKLQDIGPAQLNDLYAQLLKAGKRNGPGGLGAKTVRYIHAIIHKSFSDAVDIGLLATNPVERSKPPRPRVAGQTELRFWEPAQLRAFLRISASHRLSTAWHLAAMTGMRRGEVLGLRWGDIDFERSRLHIRQALVSVAYELIFSTPKNHKARVIDLDATTVVKLRAHKALQLSERAVWGADYQDQDLVFPKENGEPIHPQTYSQAFERLVAASDLPRIRLHDLRHTHATIALRAGVPPKVISERLGHEDPAFTLKQYAHVMPGMQADAARQIAELVAGTSSRAPELAVTPDHHNEPRTINAD